MLTALAVFSDNPQMSNNYIDSSVLDPEKGKDYYNFTESILRITGLPSGAAEYVTAVGAGIMIMASLYMTNILTKKFYKNEESVKIRSRW